MFVVHVFFLYTRNPTQLQMKYHEKTPKTFVEWVFKFVTSNKMSLENY